MRNLLLSVFGLMFLVFNVNASETERFAKHFNHTNKVAIHGYDVVSYFNGKAEVGTSEFQVAHKGITFHFVTLANATAFEQSPAKYLPAYGGWCATAVAMMNKKLDITPDSFLIENGVLYLFSTSMGPAKDMWSKDSEKMKVKADSNWTKMSSN